MPLKQLAILALLIAVTPCWAGERDKRDTRSRDGTRSVTDRRTDIRRTRDAQIEERPILRENPDDGIRPIPGTPRAAMKKFPTFELKPEMGSGGSFIIKFMDQVKARCEEGKVSSYSGVDLSALDKLIRDNSLEIEPLFKISFERLAAIEDKAVNFSNKAQPDLASMMKISGPRGSLLQAARQLNDMAIVEYVEFEKTTVPAMQGVNIACCIQSGVGRQIMCVSVSLPDCIAMNGSPNEEAIGPFACFDANGDNVPDACVGACCFKTPLGAFTCQSDVSPLDCTLDSAQFIEGTFSGRGTNCLLDGGVINCELRGACCVDIGIGEILCVQITKEDCLARGENATFTTAGRDCDDTDDDPCTAVGCGDDTAGNCYIPTPPPLGGIEPTGNSPFCDQANCCQAVCTLIPRCCDNNVDNPGDWGPQCAALANILREDPRDDIPVLCIGSPPPPLGPCNISGTSCFTASVTPGCSIFSCCQQICSIDPSCCNESLSWDNDCVALANALCSTTDQSGPTPDFFDMGLQGYLTKEPYFGVPQFLVSGMIIPNCVGSGRSSIDAPAFLTSPPYGPIRGYSGEGFDIAGLESVGSALAGLGKGDITMSRGKNIKLGLIDHSAYIQPHLGVHEDLVGQVTVMPTNRTMTLLPAPIADVDHGTAVLGILAANSTNDLGIVSMAPDAEVFFFPASTLEDGGRTLAAMVDVVEAFDPGDVVYIALSTGQFGINGCGHLLSGNLSNWLIAQLLTNSGITVIIPADNNACDLIANPQVGDGGTNDAGAIIVGAVSPGLPFTRIGASNHCTQCTDQIGDIVHVAGWGAAVATLGTGDMWDGDNVADPTNNYTNSFRYTSAAGAQIAALVARYQGLAKQMYGIPLSPRQIRGTGNNDPRGLFHLDFLNFQDDRFPLPPLGTPNGGECFGDFSNLFDPNVVMGLPDALRGAAWAIVGPHFGDASRLLRNVTIVRGKLIYGNHFALGTIDQNYLIVESEYTTRNQGANPVEPPDPTLRSIRYLAAGQIADIVVDLEAELTLIEQLEINLTMATSTNIAVSFNLLIVELYDWTNRRWDFVGFDSPINSEDTDYNFPVDFGVQRFVRAVDDKIKVRIYTIGLGSTGSTSLAGAGGSPYTVRYDFVNIDVGVVPGGGQIEHPLP